MENNKKILWMQVFSLGMVQGAIALSWVVYNAYLGKLLVELGFPESLKSSLLTLELALTVIMEPIMGFLSDNAKRSTASHFPFISVGVILSCTLFMAIPATVIFLRPDNVLRYIFPVIVVAWALAMTIFHSPVLSLLKSYAKPKSLPMAASILTLITGIIGLFKQPSQKYLVSLPPMLTFSIATFVLLGSAYLLRLIHPPEKVSDKPVNNHQAFAKPVSITTLGIIFGLGCSFSWGQQSITTGVKEFLKLSSGNEAALIQMVFFNFGIAIAALLAGAIAKKTGNHNVMFVGAIGTAVLVSILPISGVTIVTLAPLAIAISFVRNGAIPFALEMLPSNRSALAVGAYLGGLSLSKSLFNYISKNTQFFAPEFIPVIMSAIAFAVIGICIMSSRSLSRSIKEA